MVSRRWSDNARPRRAYAESGFPGGPMNVIQPDGENLFAGGLPVSLHSEKLPSSLWEKLRKANTGLAARYPGESPARQPVHTVYGGAHLFKANRSEEHTSELQS